MLPFHTFTGTSGCYLPETADGADRIWSQARDLYERASGKNLIDRIRHFLHRHARRAGSTCLGSASPAGGGHYAGIQAVSIAQIHGSEGRCSDFDADFRPLAEHDRGRWLRIARARLQGAELPPVDLIRVRDGYFVRDGHHRISVAHAFGEEYIEAEVTEW